MVRFDIVDAANVAFAVDPVEQPGATLDILAVLRVKPGCVQEVAWPKHEGFYPGQQVITTQSLPAFQVGVADATVEGVNQI